MQYIFYPFQYRLVVDGNVYYILKLKMSQGDSFPSQGENQCLKLFQAAL